MGKKKIIDEGSKAPETAEVVKAVEAPKLGKKRFESGILYVQSTYNNTKLVLTDPKGNTLAWSTSGAIGFKGAKKGTPFAAAKIGEKIAEKAAAFGIKEVRVVVKGVGSGRESAIRGFISKGINLTTITDATPVPHNGPKAPRPRRA
ncbi:MAG: ribosomal protein small subunit ribosomal protein [Parcubacteria group bacterium]|nr:ribosomal protein small subunit ribosomal protein [Parcubacteria group bacterium]